MNQFEEFPLKSMAGQTMAMHISTETLRTIDCTVLSVFKEVNTFSHGDKCSVH